MYTYIVKNKFLFWFSLCLFLEFFLAVVLLVSYYNAHSAFENLKNSTTIKSAISSKNWDFWDFLTRSGESMKSYRLIANYKNYNETHIVKWITDFFTTTNSQSTPTGSSGGSSGGSSNNHIFNNFRSFNAHLQLSLASISGLIFLTIANIYLFLSLTWNYLLKSNSFNFWKLALVTIFNIWGFYACYSWEKELEMEDPARLCRKSSLLTNFFLLKLIWKAKNAKRDFNDNTYENLITIKNLYFSPDIKHSFLKHALNHYWFLKDNMKIDEKSHLYEKPSRLFKKKETKYILKNINLNIKKGSFNVIIGPNGSGKTTLIKALINLHENIRGEILWNGQDISKINKTAFARKVSYIPQFLNVEHSISIIDFLNFSRYPYRQLEDNSPEKDTKVIMDAIKNGGCKKLTGKMIDELSGGQRQKILLTSVLVQESETIVLDEPTSFLDIKNQHQFLETLKEFHRQGKTIIMILHDLQQSINYADNLIVMKNGEIKASGHPRDIVTPSLLKDAFSINCDIHKSGNYMKISNIYTTQ